MKSIVLICILGVGASFVRAEATKADGTPTAEQIRAHAARIDELIEKEYPRFKVEGNPVIDDSTYVRRTYLAIAGRIPTVRETTAFLDSDYPEKRERLVNQLLSSEGYVSHFFHYWADILRINQGLGNNGNARAAEIAYRLWLKDALRQNKPYDQFVYDMVSAEGAVWDNGAAGYYLRDRGMPLDNMSNTVRIFLGTRLECAQCHDHPFDSWKQMDFYQMAGFTYGVDMSRYGGSNSTQFTNQLKIDYRKKYEEKVGLRNFPYITDEPSLKRAIENPKLDRSLKGWNITAAEFEKKAKEAMAIGKALEKEARGLRDTIGELYDPIQYTAITVSEKNVRLPHDYQYSDAEPKAEVEPVAMFSNPVPTDANLTRQQAYATWMTSPENPRFTTVISNRLWKEVFGVGLIEPVDEFTDQTVASHPELLSYLETMMRDFDYDMKRYLEVLYTTNLFQRGAFAEEITPGLPYSFTGPALRRMTSEQIWDSMVALMKEDPDRLSPNIDKELAYLEEQKQIYESLELVDYEDFVKVAQESSKVTRENLAGQEAIREKILEAKQADDLAKVRELSTELNRLRGSLRKSLGEIAYDRVSEGTEMADLMDTFGVEKASLVSDEQRREQNERLKLTPPPGLDKSELRDWQNKNKESLKAWSSLSQEFVRAVDISSPARRGHFLREFGQSDREVIENASIEASVPQALALLNGNIPGIVSNSYSLLSREIAQSGNPAEALNMVYLAMLSRKPNAAEQALLSAELEAYGDKAYENVVWALLNTSQFLFIQ